MINKSFFLLCENNVSSVNHLSLSLLLLICIYYVEIWFSVLDKGRKLASFGAHQFYFV